MVTNNDLIKVTFQLCYHGATVVYNKETAICSCIHMPRRYQKNIDNFKVLMDVCNINALVI
jgi:hypothetical protein